MDHAARGAETKLDVIDEPEPGPADRMEIVVRCREDNRARQSGEESLQPAEDDGGVLRHDERLDAMTSRCVVPAADAGGKKRAGRELFGKGIPVFHGVRALRNMPDGVRKSTFYVTLRFQVESQDNQRPLEMDSSFQI